MKRALSSPVRKLLNALVPSAGLRKGELSTIVCPSPMPKHIPVIYGINIRQPMGCETRDEFFNLLRSKKLESFASEFCNTRESMDYVIRTTMEINIRHYDFIGNDVTLHPYFVHNIFRDIFGIEKLYDYEILPETKITVSDLVEANRLIGNFKFIMAASEIKLDYQVKKTVAVKHGRTIIAVELITPDNLDM